MSNFNQIEARLNSLGYYFIDDNIASTYTDVNGKYNIKDENGYKYYCCLKHLFRGYSPNFVGTTNPYCIDNIKLWIQHNCKDYTLLSSFYKNSRDYLILKCNICGVEFKRSWNNLANGNGCRSCRYNNQRVLQTRPRKKDTKPLSFYSDICKDWSRKNGRPYTDFYSGSGAKVFWECSKCGYEWSMSIAHRIKDGSGCPKCANKMSKGETYIYNYLMGKQMEFCKEYSFLDCRDVNPLPFDFYLPQFNLCIEYDGIQHFKPTKFSKSMTDSEVQAAFDKTQKHDKIKQNYCINNGINLCRITYKENIKERLDEILKSVA